jgi:hypothetical protein
MRLWVKKRWSRRSIAADYSMRRPFGKACAAALDGIVSQPPEQRMKPAVGDVTLTTKRSEELPFSVMAAVVRLIEFTRITLSGPVLVMVVLRVMFPKV